MQVKEPLSLKYRPKKLSEVIGQPVVVKAFSNAFKSNTLHHAYILAGNFGCGKTTVARIIAAMENCKEEGKNPCGKCSNCVDIFNGRSYEVIEIDAASSGGIDDIRGLHKDLYQCPVECKVKYVIMDEAHRLSGAAAEASLKMIEEPPPFVRFVLCIEENQIVYSKNDKHIKIKDIKNGDSILTEDGFLEIKNKFYKGKSLVYDLRTTGGSILRLTNSHRVRVFNGNSIIWKKVKDVTDTDYLPVFHSHYDKNKNTLCDLTLDECEFLGRMVGDGYYTYKRLGVLFNKKELKYGRNLLDKLGYSYKEYEKGGCSDIKIYNKNSYIKKRFQLENYKKGEKIIPSVVYGFDKNQIKKFLDGLIGADGYVDKNGYKRLYSNNLLLMSQLKSILISYGYHTTLVQNNRVFSEDSKTTGIKKGEYTSYAMLFLEREPTIRISKKLRKKLIEKYSSCKNLGKKIGNNKQYHLSRKMLNTVKEPELQYLKKNCRFEKFHSLTVVGESKVYDLEMTNTSQSFISNGFSVHNCTTEPQSFKPTIHSRCILWSFNKVSWPEILKHLEKIAQKEELDCEEKALQVAAKHSKGSVRDSLQHLQTMMNYVGDDKITVEAAREALGVIDENLYFDLLDGIINKDTMKCFYTINQMFIDGKEVKVILDGIYGHLNNLLITRTCKNDLDSFDFTQEETKRYLHQNSKISAGGGDMLLQMMNLLNEVAFGVEYSLNPAQLFNKFAVQSVLVMKRK